MSDRIEPCPDCRTTEFLVIRSADSEMAVECRKCGRLGKPAALTLTAILGFGGEAVTWSREEAAENWNSEHSAEGAAS